MIAGASVRERARTRRDGASREERLAQLRGAVGAFASTLASRQTAASAQLRDGQPLLAICPLPRALAALVVSPPASAQ